MSLGPRTQNEITDAVRKVPGILKWLAQLEEKIKNNGGNSSNELEGVVTSLTELQSVSDKQASLMATLDKKVQDLTKDFDKKVQGLTKDFDKKLSLAEKTIASLEKKIDSKKKDSNTSLDTNKPSE